MTSRVPRFARITALCTCIVALSACDVLTRVLPSAGPTRSQIFAGSVQNEGDAFVVEVNQRVTAATSLVPTLGFPRELLNAGVSNTDLIRPGDLLSLTIFENVTDGLLAGEGANAAQLTTLQVDTSGFIFIPYAGRIRAAGNTPEQLREVITRNLDEQTPDPQVIVTREAGDGATVVVAGDVNGQGIFPIERPTRTLSGVLAAAGGSALDPEVTRVTLVRGGHTGTVWYQDIFRDPNVDVALRADDRIVVEGDTRQFTALGATGAQTIVEFESRVISAIDAIASVGGLNPSLADPTGVFVLRNEPEELANLVLGRDDLIGTQRMIYVLDLTAPTGMFEARDFVIRDGDTVYVTSAPITQFNTAISALTGTLSGVTGLTESVGAAN
ncbi:polysaccharide biosynthesis/export family protein [Gymnodinialimonas ceratoperidinii]|uniref:Polysaccharide biosynthesis/export family protein n=1 Tax=Gymnodinialimonas ceratoperidinii TaxID=2856823 RepID=A0A8F6TZS3_9RHOB|nr:polysaccharide biosynthesis/export family protein [Gymnodinialimonas ceratoperidinii]